MLLHAAALMLMASYAEAEPVCPPATSDVP